MVRIILLAIGLTLALMACRPPQDVIFDEVVEGVRGSPNERACAEAGDLSRQTSRATQALDEGDFEGVAAVFADTATKMRNIGQDAESDLSAQLFETGDAYADFASAIRALDQAGMQAGDQRLREEIQALATACGGSAEDMP